MASLGPVERDLLEQMVQRRPDLAAQQMDVVALHLALVDCFDNGGKLLVCGNGGSQADALHIVGELCKTFERKRPLDLAVEKKLRALPFGDVLAENLESGLAAITLGLNPSLKTAVENDTDVAALPFAQEIIALGRPGDVLLAISTSGNAVNCQMAMSAAKALDMVVAVLTGPRGGAMAPRADVVIKAPGDAPKTIQEAHLVLYHTFCAMIEAHYFPELR